MKVVSFEHVIPKKNTSQEKINIIYNFIQGVQKVGLDEGYVHSSSRIVDCDVAVIQGWQHERGKTAPHLALRQQIIDTQYKRQKYVITGDSNLFLYANNSNSPHHYLRYSFNGIFPNTGIYCDDNPDPKRWQQIQRDTGIQLQDYKTKGKNIVLCVQRNGGWSMGTLDVQDWIIDTVKRIRKHSDRTIVIRSHPGDKKAQQYFTGRFNRISNLPNVKLSEFGTPLEVDLNKAWAVVNHNSSSIVGPIIQGYHAFCTDPEKSQCAEVTHHNFQDIETPKEFDRQQWLERISMFHWKFSELEDGTAWRHMRNYVRQ
tara:strand:- start:100 stop:1041 length:942 start_codon:yes stop_codon:yes gene_type:complete